MSRRLVVDPARHAPLRGAWSGLALVLVLTNPVLSGERLETLSGVRHFDTDDGLRSSYVRGIAQDTVGTVWVGTSRGLARYDGALWRDVPLPATGVSCVLATEEFGVIVGTDWDAYSFVRNTSGELEAEVWTPFEHPYLRSSADSAKRQIHAIQERVADGAVWFATPTGAKLYTIFEWIAVDTGKGLPTDTVHAIAPVGRDTTWLGTAKGLFLRVREQVSQPVMMPKELRRGAIDALAWDEPGQTLWIGSASGLFSVSRGRWSRLSSDRPGGPGVTHVPNARVHCLLSDRNGTMYVGSDDWLAVHGPSTGPPGSQWTLIPAAHGVRSLALDREGMLWIGTDGDGVYRWKPQLSRDGGGWASGAVTAMAPLPNGELVIAAGRELWKMDAHGFIDRMFRTSRWERVNALSVSARRADGPTIWVGTENGLFGVRDGGIVLALDERSMIGGAPVQTLFLDRNGALWIGAESGVWLLHPSDNRLVAWSRPAGAPGGNRPGHENPLYPIAETRDSTVWMGTPHGVFGIQRGRLFPITHVTGQVLGQVRFGTVTPDGALWFGDDDGHVVRLTASPDTSIRWETTLFGMDDGVRGIHIRAITAGADSSLWLATDGGVNRFRDGLWTYYGTEQGLYSRDAWIAAPVLPTLVLVGTERGLELLKPDVEPPETELLDVPPTVSSAGYLTVQFRGTDRWKHTPSNRLRYRWRLDGGAWSPAESSNHVALADMSPGCHTFAVAALDGDLNWDPTPAVAEFLVETPVWRRWYVAVIMLAFVAAVIALVVRLVSVERRLRSYNAGERR